MNFHKYSANGNDFVILEDSSAFLTALHDNVERGEIQSIIKLICDRRFGIGADGLLLLLKSKKADFAMRYWNSDGLEVGMCGNGARALASFAYQLKGFSGELSFTAPNGALYYVQKTKTSPSCVEILMSEAFDRQKIDLSDLAQELAAQSYFYINTGVPHSIFEYPDVQNLDLNVLGPRIRFDHRFQQGVNVNFFTSSQQKDTYVMRTYERGVEAETMACGTGAIALAHFLRERFYPGREQQTLQFKVSGGILKVRWSGDDFYLSGDVCHCFSGSFDFNQYVKRV